MGMHIEYRYYNFLCFKLTAGRRLETAVPDDVMITAGL